MDITMSAQRRRPCVAHPLLLLAIAALTILVGACQPIVTPSNQATETVVPTTSSPDDVTSLETPPATALPDSTGDRDATEEPVAITSTVIPSATVRSLDWVQAFVGKWASGRSSASGRPPEFDPTAPTLEILEDGGYSMAYYFGRETPIQSTTGTLTLRDDGSIELSDDYVAVPHAELLLVQYGSGDTAYVLQRIEEDGTLRPYAPADSITPPAVEASTVITLSILDAWTGLSPAAPIEAYFDLKPDTTAFLGRAELSVAGYTTPITKTVAISVPVSIVNEFLTLIASTPLEEGDYQPVMSHTDDYPTIVVAIETANDEVIFGSKSQGLSHVPWGALINQKPYITYADTLARAMALLDPYLARAERDELVEQAMQRETDE